MDKLVKIEDVKDVLISLRGEKVILDVDVAKLYGVTTREVNQAMRNNPDKFPEGYVLTPDRKEYINLRSKFLTTKISPKSRQIPKAFTEKGLYMLATILKSPIAIQTTLAIVETFAQIRELKEEISDMHNEGANGNQTSRIERIGALIADIMMPDLKTSETEASMEVNLVFSKFTYTVKRTRMQELKDKLTEIAGRMLDNGFTEEEIKRYLK